MKRLIVFSLCVCLSFLLVFPSCSVPLSSVEGEPSREELPPVSTGVLGGEGDSFGEAITEDSAVYEGYFEEDLKEITVECLSGTPEAWVLEGNELRFLSLSEDSVYSLSGRLKGSIVIDVGEDCKLDLELTGFSLVSDGINPVRILSGNEVSLTAKKDTKNYIYDLRDAVDERDETLTAGAVHAECDLEICGKGELTVVSKNNKGIHTKDDLQVKNLTLFVSCTDNALKGNDSVEITDASTTLIATLGDGIKTSNSDVSEKGKQRGSVVISGGVHTVYAACDGIDAAYDVVIEESSTVLNVYTDRYSNYSEEVTVTAEEGYYLRFPSDAYRFSVKYSDETGRSLWVNAEEKSQSNTGREQNVFYSFPKAEGYGKIQVFIYSSEMTLSQEEEYLACTETLSISSAYDTLAFTLYAQQLSYGWTSYSTASQQGQMGGPGGYGPGGRPGGGMGGFGGMQEGNTEKSEYSTKGIKAANRIQILQGSVNVKSYDDALHANGDAALENGEAALGEVQIRGGTLSVYSNDDGLHADGILQICGGTVSVLNSYEGLEGSEVRIEEGFVSVISNDDGVNSTLTSGTGITVSGGTLYVYAGGDGLDANSRTSYGGILFAGGNSLIVSTSGGNSCIDTEQGYSFTGGSVVALMPSGGMSGEAVHCQNFQSVGTRGSFSLGENQVLTVSGGEGVIVSLKLPRALSGLGVVLGSNKAKFSVERDASYIFDANGVCWQKSGILA